jgi:hypothetical protein
MTSVENLARDDFPIYFYDPAAHAFVRISGHSAAQMSCPLRLDGALPGGPLRVIRKRTCAVHVCFGPEADIQSTNYYRMIAFGRYFEWRVP